MEASFSGGETLKGGVMSKLKVVDLNYFYFLFLFIFILFSFDLFSFILFLEVI